jgi:hypothetical protein
MVAGDDSEQYRVEVIDRFDFGADLLTPTRNRIGG